MSDEPNSVVEQHTYAIAGDDTVTSAARAIDRLPNGWHLVNIRHERGYWVCVVKSNPKVIEP